jgi:hypothetical protein
MGVICWLDRQLSAFQDKLCYIDLAFNDAASTASSMSNEKVRLRNEIVSSEIWDRKWSWPGCMYYLDI